MCTEIVKKQVSLLLDDKYVTLALINVSDVYISIMELKGIVIVTYQCCKMFKNYACLKENSGLRSNDA